MSVCDKVYYGAPSHCRRVESCIIIFLAGNFLFTSSDTFAVGCIIQPQNQGWKMASKNLGFLDFLKR